MSDAHLRCTGWDGQKLTNNLQVELSNTCPSLLCRHDKASRTQIQHSVIVNAAHPSASLPYPRSCASYVNLLTTEKLLNCLNVPGSYVHGAYFALI